MWLASSLASLAAAIALHAGMGRAALIANSVVRFLAAGAALGLALTTWLMVRHGPLSVELWSGTAVYALSCQLYIFLFTLPLGSISANLLLRLSQRPLPLSEVMQLYTGRRMVELRIGRLVGSGFLTREPDGLKLTTVGLTTAVMYERVRLFFRHDQPS